MGAPSTITGRLLSYEEADASKEIGLEYDEELDKNISIIYNGTSYWLGSVKSDYYLWYVYSNLTWFSDNSYDIDDLYGVRPVIEIPTSEIE